MLEKQSQERTEIEPNGVESTVPDIDWENTWSHCKEIKDPTKYVNIYLYLHNTWWTQETAYHRYIIHYVNECLVCNSTPDSKDNTRMQTFRQSSTDDKNVFSKRFLLLRFLYLVLPLFISSAIPAVFSYSR